MTEKLIFKRGHRGARRILREAYDLMTEDEVTQVGIFMLMCAILGKGR